MAKIVTLGLKWILLYLFGAVMLLYDAAEVQHLLAQHLRAQRKAAGLSRSALAQRSLVPAPTIKKFELSGQISLRQFVLLWQCLDDLPRLVALTEPQPVLPSSIQEVLDGPF